MHFIFQTHALIDIGNFIKWLALKAFIINEVSNATKIANFFLGRLYFKCNLKNP